MLLAGCGNGVGSNGGQQIDQASDAALQFLYGSRPDSSDIASRSAGILVMPQITEAGLGVGGSYGRGALRVGDISVDYYSAAQASFGFQVGAQQYSHALFFMTEDALRDFRQSDGWVAGANVKYAIDKQGDSLGTDTTQINAPVIAYVFAQSGAIVGATLEGTKYTRIIP
ncbi:MAG: YSC84-related protein [Pseudomonadota bacterium]